MTDEEMYEAEHPAAKRMRLEFEAKYGDMADVMRAMNHWFNKRTEWNEPFNRDREQPVTESDVDAALKRVFAAVRTARRSGLDAPASHIEVRAEVRYWEDATVNDTEDDDGALIPLRDGDRWCPVIRLADGLVLNWPQGTRADIHYKVCDQGEYWMQDAQGHRVAKWAGDYVPDDFLCHGDTGYGDYIILKIGSDGLIEQWRTPTVDAAQWRRLDAEHPKDGE